MWAFLLAHSFTQWKWQVLIWLTCKYAKQKQELLDGFPVEMALFVVLTACVWFLLCSLFLSSLAFVSDAGAIVGESNRNGIHLVGDTLKCQLMLFSFCLSLPDYLRCGHFHVCKKLFCEQTHRFAKDMSAFVHFWEPFYYRQTVVQTCFMRSTCTEKVLPFTEALLSNGVI